MAIIRVLYCQETVGSGGVEKRKLSTARYLDRSKYQIKLACTAAREPLATEFANAGVELIVIGKLKHIFDFTKYYKLLKIIKQYKPHIIHGAVFEGVALACIAGYLGRVQIIIAEETSDPQNRTARASKLLRGLTSVADKVIAIAPSVGAYLKSVAMIPEHKIQVINNGVELPRAVTAAEVQQLRDQYNIKPTDVVVGSVGRLLDDHKKFTDIIKAVAALPRDKNVKILIVGDGKDSKLIKDTAVENGIADRLIMTGYQHDTAPFYAAMDVFCLASQREGFGLVAVEAMLHKLPVVASRVGGLKDVVVDGATGFLVNPNEPSDLTEKLLPLINDADKRNHLGNAGYTRAINEFTAEVYVKKVAQLYEGLLDKKGIAS